MPADHVSPLKLNEGPAIQMDPLDHVETSSNGPSKQAAFYRKTVGDLIKKKQWREAMTIEIKNVRKIVKNSGSPRKYNEAMLEMLEYFKCLEKHGLLP